MPPLSASLAPPPPPCAPLPTVVVAAPQAAHKGLLERGRRGYLKECAAVAHFLCAWRAFVAPSTAGWLDTIHCLGADPRRAMQLRPLGCSKHPRPPHLASRRVRTRETQNGNLYPLLALPNLHTLGRLNIQGEKK